MLTVCCVWVRGPVPYTAEYVIRLERMVRRFLTRDFRFVCLTDQPKALPAHIGAIPIRLLPSPDNGAGFWQKVQLFRTDLGFDARVLYLDLDVLVVDVLDAIVDYPAAFALTRDTLVEERAHIDEDRYGRRIIRKFNSSVMVWNGGEQAHIFERWRPGVTERLSTDQDWIAEQCPAAHGMPTDWFPRISRVQPPWPNAAKVVLVKKPKPHDAIQRWPWFGEMWGGWGMTA